MSAPGVGARVESLGLRHSRISVTTASGIHADPLADFALAGILYFGRALPQLIRDRRDRFWRTGIALELRSPHVVIIGAGQIGTRLAQLLDVLGVRTTGVARRAREHRPPFTAVVEPSLLTELLPSAEILVIAAPLTQDTRSMIGAYELGQLPRGAVVVNLGWGPIIDEPALIHALGT